MKRAPVALAFIGLAAMVFWIVDLPSTVRIKVAIVKLLPIEPESTNSIIHSLCAGAHASSINCYMSFYSKEAYEATQVKRKCEAFRAALAKGELSDWQQGSSDTNTYLNIGDKAEKGMWFIADECLFKPPGLSGLIGGKGFTFRP